MSLVLLFALLLILLFGILFYFLKPTSMEKAVEEQLASIEEAQSQGSDRTTILKERTIRSGTLEDLAQKLPWSPAASRLIRQAGRDWPLGSVLLFSLIAGVGGYWLVSLGHTIVTHKPLPDEMFSGAKPNAKSNSPIGNWFRQRRSALPRLLDL